MKTTLIAAISTDGYIADGSGSQSWTTDEDGVFLKDVLRDYDVCIMGKTTFLHNKSKFLNKAKIRIVMTSQPQYYQKKYPDYDVLFCDKSLKELINTYKSQNIAILGGSSVYTQAIKQALCSDMYITHEAITLGSGVPFLLDPALLNNFHSTEPPIPTPKAVTYYVAN